ncbi:MAG: ATP-binding cassette domain-containing protein [Planctomycetota bacterium]|nr:ATP-binding cassette domain-containing protein [Planctomycetota bacterium]
MPTPTPAPPREAALSLRGAAVQADGREILAGVDLSVAAGERVALIGPSGAGKTTLLRLLGTSLWADRGDVEVLGVDPRQLRSRALRRLRGRVGFLRQQDNLVLPLRVAHNVLMGRLGQWSTLRALWNLIRPGELDRAREALQQVELEDRLWALPEELSGGERQRVAVARLLVQRPEVVLADEPVSALDLRLGRDIVDLLLSLARARDAAAVISLHSLDLLDRGFDRVVALRDGRVAWQGDPAGVDQATLRDVYGADYERVLGDEARAR